MNDKPLAFSCRNFSRPLAWLRASLSASDNHQDTFCCCGKCMPVQMSYLASKECWSSLKHCQMHPVPVSCIHKHVVSKKIRYDVSCFRFCIMFHRFADAAWPVEPMDQGVFAFLPTCLKQFLNQAGRLYTVLLTFKFVMWLKCETIWIFRSLFRETIIIFWFI